MKTASLRQNLTFNDEKVTIDLIMETDISKEIRLSFKKGQLMKEHKAGYPITVEVHHGAITFGVNGKHLDLTTGDIIYLDANVPHDLLATEDSIVRLTLSKHDKVERVMGVPTE